MQKIADFAKENNVKIIKEYHDKASSAGERSGFFAMIDGIKFDDLKVDYIYITELSRFSRDWAQLDTLIEELKELGVEIIAVS